jgi:hypothetical protein
MEWDSANHSANDPALSALFKRTWGDLLSARDTSAAIKCAANFINDELIILRKMTDEHFVSDCSVATKDPKSSLIFYPLWLTAVGQQKGDARNDPNG